MKRYTLKLTMTGPLMATGVEAVAHGVDAPFLRDHKNRIIIPGSQIRGIVRHVMQSMAEAAPGKLDPARVKTLFGSASADAAKTDFGSDTGAWAPAVGQIVFSDLTGSDRTAVSSAMTRIAVDSFTGSVAHGSLQVLEQPIGIGEKVVFSGTVDIDSRDGDEGDVSQWIRKALFLTPALGAHKSAGFGRVERVELQPAEDIEPRKAAADQAISDAVRSGAADLVITFDGPFLVSAGRWSSNIYTGSYDVPGSVFKAVVGRLLGADKAAHVLHEALANCVVTELRPAEVQLPRPQKMPASLYYIEAIEEFGDAISSPPEVWTEDSAISFFLDWKSAIRAKALLGYPNVYDKLNYHVRTRTAINDTGTADTGKLFSFSAVDPAEYVWKGQILKGRLTDEQFAALLCELPGRLDAIGKTRVGADLVVTAAKVGAKSDISGEVVAVLETDACLHTPDDVLAFEDAPNPSEQLRRQYQYYFASALRERASDRALDFSADDLNLTFYATQRRVGGYIAARYPVSSLGYHPWLLTNAGSVFRFTVPKGCEEAAHSFVKRGLPPPSGFDASRKSWSGNPFVPENGFGEVRLTRVQ